MAYIGGGAQPITDWEAHDEIWKLRRDVTALQAQVADLAAARQQLDAANERAEKVARERDSLARRLNLRFGQLEEARAARAQYEADLAAARQQLDQLRAVADEWDHEPHDHDNSEGAPDCAACWVATIRHIAPARPAGHDETGQ